MHTHIYKCVFIYHVGISLSAAENKEETERKTAKQKIEALQLRVKEVSSMFEH